MVQSKRANNPQNSAPKMTSKDELAKLRADIKRKQRNVQAKINRIENSKGINLRATSYAPSLADAHKIGRMTAKQLIALGNKLDSFTHRSTQFVALADGTPVSLKAWQAYKSAETAYNNFGKDVMTTVKDIRLPGVDSKGKPNGMTVGEREATMRKDGRSILGDASQKSYVHIERKPEQIASPEALDKLTKQMQEKISRKYLPSRVKAGRKEAGQMIDEMNNKELRDKLKGLSDYQFHILWEHTRFAEALGGQYAIHKSANTRSESRWYQKVLEDNAIDIAELIDWARQLPQKPNNARGKKDSR